MTKEKMNYLLSKTKGTGVVVKRIDDSENYYFYEDFSKDDLGIDRAVKQCGKSLDKGNYKQVTYISN